MLTLFRINPSFFFANYLIDARYSIVQLHASCTKLACKSPAALETFCNGPMKKLISPPTSFITRFQDMAPHTEYPNELDTYYCVHLHHPR